MKEKSLTLGGESGASDTYHNSSRDKVANGDTSESTTMTLRRKL